MLFSSIAIPAFAEVETIQTDKLFYSNGDKIIFSGTVDYDSTGLVSIVIRDSNEKFVSNHFLYADSELYLSM